MCRRPQLMLYLLAALSSSGCKQRGEQPATKPAHAMPVATTNSKEATIIFTDEAASYGRTISFDGKTRRVAPLPRAETDALVTALRDTLEFGEPSEVQGLYELLRRGYERLLANFGPELQRADSLVIRAVGLLRFIPFHALLRDEGGREKKARFVIQRWVVSYLPQGIPSKTPDPPRRAIAVVAGYGREKRPLKEALAEAKLVRAEHWMPTPTIRQRATPSQWLSALRAPRGIVHFIGHGLPNLEGDGAPELLFGAESSVKASAIARTRVESSLVVLAACTTAYAARFRAGAPRLARRPLPEVLLRAGAGAVIAASWGVKDAQSRAQMATFYQHLASKGPAVALALAQRERIARLSPPHPRYWAFYALYGAPRFEAAR